MRAINPTVRCGAPVVVGSLLWFGTLFAGPVLTWLMLMIGFGLILDGVTKWWERAGGTGNLTTHKQ